MKFAKPRNEDDKAYSVTKDESKPGTYKATCDELHS